MWKGGSGPHFLRRKIGASRGQPGPTGASRLCSGTIFSNPSMLFGHFPRKIFSRNGPNDSFSSKSRFLCTRNTHFVKWPLAKQCSKTYFNIVPWSEIATGIVRNRRYRMLRPPPGGLLAAESIFFFVSGPVAPSPWSEITPAPLRLALA